MSRAELHRERILAGIPGAYPQWDLLAADVRQELLDAGREAWREQCAVLAAEVAKAIRKEFADYLAKKRG